LPGRATKSGKARFIYFTADVASHLRELAAALFPAGEKPSGGIFVWPTNERQLIIEVDRIHAAAGVERQKYRAFHGIRKSCGTMVAATQGLQAAQARLGHSSIAITARHYAKDALAGIAAAAAPPMPTLPPAKLRIVG
jgi:integrase